MFQKKLDISHVMPKKKLSIYRSETFHKGLKDPVVSHFALTKKSEFGTACFASGCMQSVAEARTYPAKGNSFKL